MSLLSRHDSAPRVCHILSVIEFELIGVASHLDSVAVGIQEGDGTVAADFQVFRTARYGDALFFENRVERIHLLGRFYVNAEMMESWRSFTARVFGSRRQLHKSDIMVLPPETQK